MCCFFNLDYHNCLLSILSGDDLDLNSTDNGLKHNSATEFLIRMLLCLLFSVASQGFHHNVLMS